MKVKVKLGDTIVSESVELQNQELIEETVSLWPDLPKHIRKKFVSENQENIDAYLDDLKFSNTLRSRKKLFMMQNLFSQNSISAGISCNFDAILFPNGFMKGELTVLSGISGGGKTALSIMITSVSIGGYNRFLENPEHLTNPVIYVSLEQPKHQLQARIISTLLALNTENDVFPYSDIINYNAFSSKKSMNLGFSLFELYRKNLIILDKTDFGGTPSVQELNYALENRLIFFDKKPLVIIDRYENIDGANNNSDDFIVREIKSFAEINRVPLLLQAQMNKGAITTSSKNSGKFDETKISSNSLKGTSGLEHHASEVLIIVPDGSTREFEGVPSKFVTIIHPKSRFGCNDSIKMLFRGQDNIFVDYNETRGRKKKIEEVDNDETDGSSD